jgi:hypothetical protein
MSVNAYFNKRGPGLRMPQTGAQPDPTTGITYHGDALQGLISIDEAFARQKHIQEIHTVQTALRTGAPCAVSVEAYDPVLRYHTRTGKPSY